jgi:hypothetical protein
VLKVVQEQVEQELVILEVMLVMLEQLILVVEVVEQDQVE